MPLLAFASPTPVQTIQKQAEPVDSPNSTRLPGTLVNTSEGQVLGQEIDSVFVFKGIPFAAPPVENLRWREAQAPTPRQGLLPANVFGPACMQPKRGSRPVHRQSEDCLTLNVWAPKANKASAPVMVWIHGGAFRFGSGSQKYYDGAEFAKSGVVLVTINYRLGRFGFFSHPALDDQAETVNFALTDQIQALNWLRRNVAAFGGDPNNITIFGESAGAVSVGYLLTMDASQGLFHKAIMQSGNGWQIPGRVHAQRGRTKSLHSKGIAWGERHQLTAKARASELRDVAAIDVLEPEIGQGGLGNVTPVIDDILIHDGIARRFADGKAAKVPLITGSNTFEGSLLDIVKTNPRLILLALGWKVLDGRRLYQTKSRDISIKDFGYELFADGTFTGPARDIATMAMNRGQQAFVYSFDYRKNGGTAISDGAHHGWEIPFVFNNLSSSPAMFTPDTPADVSRMARNMHQYWVNFASNGNPGTVNSIRWTSIISGDVENTLIVTNSREYLAKNFRVPLLDFQHELYLGRLEKANEK